MVLRWMQCCLWALWKQQSICRLQQQGHRQDVWEVVNDDHYYFLLIFCLFVCSAQISSSIRPGRVSVYVLCFFFFLPLVNNAVTYAQSHLYFHCLSLLTKGLGTGLVPLGTAGTLVLVMDAASSSAQFGNQSSL